MINSVNQILEKKGEDYLNKIFENELVITEKLDVFRLIFEKKNDELIFYTKDNKKIDLVTRTLTDTWEHAILEIPIITKNAHISEGLFFGLYYTPIERPNRIPYSKLPRYILTDVTRRKDNKILESCTYDEVSQWAVDLCMGRPPILFKGKLNEEQKKLFIAYDTKQYDGEDMTFSKMIEKTLNASYSKEDIIEGIIIKSGDKLTQIISYEFELLNEAYEKENVSRDFYDIIITDINSFLNTYNIFVLEAESKDEMYISIVCDIFNKYCQKKSVSEKIESKYLIPPQFGYYGQLNKKFIKNKETLDWINKAPIYEALFKVILSSFRKYKKPYGLLTESIVEKFNSYVYLINNYINKFKENECNLLTEARSDNVVVSAFKKRNPTDVDNMRVIASIQKAFEPKMQEVKRGEKPCILYVTTFQPFTNSQMTNIVRMNEMWQYPVLVCGVGSKYRVEGKQFHPSDELIKAQMRALVNGDPKLIPGFILLDSWSLTELFEYARPHFEPMMIITDTGKKSEFTLQLFLEEEIMGGRVSVSDNFNIGEMENEDLINTIRSIEDNNYTLFLELTPEPIHLLFNNIFEEYRLYSGQIIKPIND
jgi:hypothetical protein